MVDMIVGIKILVMGFFVFDLEKFIGELLIGRKYIFYFFGLLEKELN